jgi:hypothetical protein
MKETAACGYLYMPPPPVCSNDGFENPAGSWLEWPKHSDPSIMPFKHTVIKILLALILGLLPVSSALGVQHALSGAESDAHAHSDWDLCDWLKIQTTGSHSLDIGPVWPWWWAQGDGPIQFSLLFTNRPVRGSSPPRAPPHSLPA